MSILKITKEDKHLKMWVYKSVLLLMVVDDITQFFSYYRRSWNIQSYLESGNLYQWMEFIYIFQSFFF